MALPRLLTPSDKEEEIKRLVAILASVKDGPLLYLSAPLTTGKRLLDWYRNLRQSENPASPASRDMRRQRVTEPNRAHAKAQAHKLRLRLPEQTVIDPTAVEDFAGWTQNDYYLLWASVIERHATLVMMLDGWCYSNGCAYEYLTAILNRKSVVSEAEEPLSLDRGLVLLQDAASELRREDLQTEIIERVIDELSHAS